ncbi:hypothetical protein D3C84_977510 [compost metagenome]
MKTSRAYEILTEELTSKHADISAVEALLKSLKEEAKQLEKARKPFAPKVEAAATAETVPAT